jgi:hypothetical protein
MVSTGFAPTYENPEYPFLDTSRYDAVAAYLAARNILILDPAERVERLEPTVGVARNAATRVVTNQRTLFLKQFRPWPARPDGVAPLPTAAERFGAESQFHRATKIGGCGRRLLPALLHSDSRAACLIFEDAGAPVRGRAKLAIAEVEELASFLLCMHHHSQSVPSSVHYGSAGVLQWQRARLFSAPARRGSWRTSLAEHGNGVRAALGDAAWAIEMDGRSLVHGDFVLANWMSSGTHRRIADAECSFFGQPEFDVGSFVASLLATRQPETVVAAGIAALTRGCMRYNARLAAAFTAAHLCAMLDESRGSRGIARGANAAALVKRAVAAIEHESLDAFLAC